LDMTLDEGRIVLVPVAKRTRDGWAEASKAIAEAGDDELVWPEFSNADDALLKW
jgi:antitoxin MazE